MLRAVPLSFLLCACGGGGGGGGPGVALPVRLAAADLDFAPSVSSGELLVQLAELPTSVPVLLQVAIELPPTLALAPGDPLLPAQTLVTLRGEMHGGRYVVVCGDDQNRQALPLRTGPLFSLRLVTSTPRQLGTHTITLRDLRAARSDGSDAGGDVNPAVATVMVR